MASPVLVEKTHHSLITEGVNRDEQTLNERKPFWVFFVINMGIPSWLVGVFMAGMGLGFTEAVLVLFVGCAIGSALPAALATLGPKTGLAQMELSRYALGTAGKKLPSFLNWMGAIGWDAVNNIMSASALIALFAIYGISLPLWLALAILVGAQLIIGGYGHHLIQATSKFTGMLLGAFFIVIGVMTMQEAPHLPVSSPDMSIKMALAALSLLVASNAGGLSPFASDYTRYLPHHTKSLRVFTPVFLALFSSLFVLAFFGYVTASRVSAETPGAVMQALEVVGGRFAPLVLLLIAFSSIPMNAINDNSAAYSLISLGLKISRVWAAALGAGLGYVLCLIASRSFAEFFENFLMLLIHWVGPWAAILLVHWRYAGAREQLTKKGLTRGCILFVFTAVTSVTLFASNSLYTGYLSPAVGDVDIGPYFGFFFAGAIYAISLRLWPLKYKAI